VPIGVSLSGGLDSSAVSMYASLLNVDSSKLPAYSVIYEDEGISERSYVESILSESRLDSYQLSPEKRDFEKDLEQLIWHQEEPFNGVGVYAQNRLFRLASAKGTKVILGGQGADEILAGYDKFLLAYVRTNSTSSPLEIIKLAVELLSRETLNPLEYGKDYLAYRGKGNRMKLPHWMKRPDAENFFHRASEKSMRGVSDNLLTTLGLRALLRYEDKNSMAFGVESRLPFLDHRLVEHCLLMPDRMKIRDGMSKWALRRITSDKLPYSILRRRDKLGYATPQEKWFDTNFYRENMILMSEVLSPFVEIDVLKNELDATIGWRLYIFGMWVKKFMS